MKNIYHRVPSLSRDIFQFIKNLISTVKREMFPAETIRRSGGQRPMEASAMKIKQVIKGIAICVMAMSKYAPLWVHLQMPRRVI